METPLSKAMREYEVTGVELGKAIGSDKFQVSRWATGKFTPNKWNRKVINGYFKRKHGIKIY